MTAHASPATNLVMRARPREAAVELDVTWREPVSVRTTAALGFVLGVLMILHAWCASAKLLFGVTVDDWAYKMFWFDLEFGLPAWFSSMMLACASALLLLVTWLRRQLQWPALATGVLSVGFLVLSVDEMLQLHERTLFHLTRPLIEAGVETRTWTAAGAVIVAIVGLSMWPMLVRLPRMTRWLFVLAGATFAGGALGFEAISGVFQETTSPLYNMKMYTIAMTIEETLEMLGVVVFIHALTSYIAALMRHRYGLDHRGVTRRVAGVVA